MLNRIKFSKRLYALVNAVEQGRYILRRMMLSAPGSRERKQLLIGRGGVVGLLEAMKIDILRTLS